MLIAPERRRLVMSSILDILPIPASWRSALAAAQRFLLVSEPYSIAPLKPVQSDAITAARVFCILGVVYVHAWTGQTWSSLVESSDSAQGIFRWLLVELIGRSSVPLLGMISGWLVASSALRRGYWSFLRGKALTILTPMLLWNALAVVLVCGAGWMGWIRAPMPNDVEWVFDEIVGYATFNNINVQTTFLRDLFICMALAPLLIRMKTRWLSMLAAITLAWSIFGWWFPLFLRPQIPLFFLLGICARRYGSADRVAAMPFEYAALPFAVFGPAKVAISIWGFQFSRENPELVATIDVGMRLAAALLAWRTAVALTGTPLLAVMKRIEPYAFFLFCSHMIMIWLAGQPLGQLSGPLGAPGYPLFLVVQPALALATAIVLGRFLVGIAPDVAKLLSGGRLRAEVRARDVLATA
jgi:surface polysaccharide O-acyltransferase-like enzyme